MEFKIFGKYYPIDKSKIIDSVKREPPEEPDNRHIYFVEIHGRKYPIKQLVRLATGLPNGMFTAQYAERILAKLGFELKEFGARPPRPQRLVRKVLMAEKCDVSLKDQTVTKFAVSLERDEDGYVTASCPALAGCHSQGRSRSEAIKNINEAIRGYIASLANHGEIIPDVDWEVVEVVA